MTLRGVATRFAMFVSLLTPPGVVFAASGGTIVITVTVEEIATGIIALEVDSSFLSWSAVADAIGYDIVRGDLLTLHSSAGNFTVATEECLADDHPTTSLAHSAVPDPGSGFWFLVRDARLGGNGAYDSGGLAQVGSRDAEIDASTRSCP